MSATLFASEPAVEFDVPALLPARVIESEVAHSMSSSLHTIEVTVPVSSEVRAADRDNLKEFRFDVFWNRNGFPICDYGPKTQTTSEFVGPILYDKISEKNAVVGLNLNGGYQGLVTGISKSELAHRDSTKTHYEEIPQHEILVASGTVKRGTGAFFRFHPSRTETLEGGRNLVVAFQVPSSWRAGLLSVECRAVGSRKVLAWSESFEHSRVFIVPLYLEGDESAREAAMELARAEQRLRSDWKRFEVQSRAESSPPLQAMLIASSTRKISAANLPANWLHYLIQSDDSYLERYREKLPTDVSDAAGQFVKARKELLKMSR